MPTLPEHIGFRQLPKDLRIRELLQDLDAVDQYAVILSDNCDFPWRLKIKQLISRARVWRPDPTDGKLRHVGWSGFLDPREAEIEAENLGDFDDARFLITWHWLKHVELADQPWAWSFARGDSTWSWVSYKGVALGHLIGVAESEFLTYYFQYHATDVFLTQTDSRFRSLQGWYLQEALEEWAQNRNGVLVEALEADHHPLRDLAPDLKSIATNHWSVSTAWLHLPIGEESIRDELEWWKKAGLMTSFAPNILEEFSDVWAIADGNETAAFVFRLKVARTTILAFPLTEITHLSGRNLNSRLSGEVHFHIDGNPFDPLVSFTVGRIKRWCKRLAGLNVSNNPEGLSGHQKIRDAQEIVEAYLKVEASDYMTVTKRKVAALLNDGNGVSVPTLNAALKRFALDWPPVED